MFADGPAPRAMGPRPERAPEAARPGSLVRGMRVHHAHAANRSPDAQELPCEQTLGPGLPERSRRPDYARVFRSASTAGGPSWWPTRLLMLDHLMAVRGTADARGGSGGLPTLQVGPVLAVREFTNFRMPCTLGTLREWSGW